MQHQDEYEIKSSLILQPGPAALTDGLDELHRIVERWASGGRSGKKAAIPHVMKSADKKELEPVTPSSTVTLNPPSATRSRNLPAGGASPEISRSSTRPSPDQPAHHRGAASGQVRTEGTSATTAGPAPDGLLTTGTQGLGAQFR